MGSGKFKSRVVEFASFAPAEKDDIVTKERRLMSWREMSEWNTESELSDVPAFAWLGMLE